MKAQSSFNFEQAIKKVKEQFDFDFVALALVQPAQLRFVLKWEYVLGNQSERYKRIILQTGKGIAGTVFKTGKPLRMSNVEKELSKIDLFNYPIIVAEKLTSFGAIPLFKEGRVEGVLLVAFRDERVVTPILFDEFKKFVGADFDPYHYKEMVEGI